MVRSSERPVSRVSTFMATCTKFGLNTTRPMSSSTATSNAAKSQQWLSRSLPTTWVVVRRSKSSSHRRSVTSTRFSLGRATKKKPRGFVETSLPTATTLMMMTSSHKPELISDLTKLHETCSKSVIFVHSCHVALFSHTFDSTRRFALNTSGVSLDCTPLLAPWAPPAFESYRAC